MDTLCLLQSVLHAIYVGVHLRRVRYGGARLVGAAAHLPRAESATGRQHNERKVGCLHIAREVICKWVASKCPSTS